MEKPKISAIVLNWNGMEVIAECLDSLLAQTYAEREILVVDNGSTDGSLAMIREKYGAHVTVIENGKNLGFAEGCNVGIRASNGELILLVNSDATLQPNWMDQAVKAFSEPRVGMAAGKIFFYDARNVIENTGHIISADALGRGRGRLEKDEGQYDRDLYVFCPNGCAAVYRRSMMEEIGLFDRWMFAYADDIDVGFRGRLAGYECAYVPSAIAYHRLSASFGLLSPFKAFLVERNRLWVLIKCFPFRYLLAAPFYTFMRYAYHFYGICHRIGPASRYVQKISLLSLLGIALRVYGSTLWHLPRLLAERFRIQGRRHLSARAFGELLKQYGMSAKDVALREISY
ncbi:MAG: glycosyltransferase family 2 protein [Candidatus Omnitrophota bacterium]